MVIFVFWEGNIGLVLEYCSFFNGNNFLWQLLCFNVMFDNLIFDGQGGYKDCGGFWCSVEWWYQDVQCFVELFVKGMCVKVEGWVIMDCWLDKEFGEEVQVLKVEVLCIFIFLYCLVEVILLLLINGQVIQYQQIW